MADLYPMLLIPEFHERVWGSRDLSPYYAHKVGRQPVGEVWLTGENCRVANGTHAGRTLKEVCQRYGRELLGPGFSEAAHFPLLIKILFPKEKLSVQVHPDDESARRIGQPCGKTECWYVLEAEAGAQVALGLKKGTKKSEVELAIQEKRMEAVLNWVNIQAGELIYVDAGTVHAIGPGSVLVETQQNSDITYRLYDYGRPRELHLQAGLEATKEQTHAGKVPARRNNGHVQLVASPCFVVDKFMIRAGEEFICGPEGTTHVQCLLVLRGGGVVEAEQRQPVSFIRGEVVVVPAGLFYHIKPQGELECYRATLPVSRVEQPQTVEA